MTKVYCKDCKYQAYTNWYFSYPHYICLAYPNYKDTALELAVYYDRCVDRNAQNNCERYKEKFWRKVWKSLASGTLN